MKNSISNITTELSLEIKTYDIDVAGHVNNIVYLKWFEDLRTKLFNEYFNLVDLLSRSLYLVVLSTEIRYKSFLKFFDKPAGIMFIGCINHGVFNLHAEIKLHGKIAASGKQRCVLFDLEKLKVVKGNKLMEIINSKPGLFTL